MLEWAEKYKERFRWRLRSSFQASNPFGKTPVEINRGLQSLLATPYVFTAAAAAVEAPFIDLDRFDIFLLPNQDDAKLRQLRQTPISQDTPKLRFIYPYDEGVFLYSTRESNFPKVSNIQAYLDLCAGWARSEAGGCSARRRHRAPMEIRMIPEPQRTYVLELLAALGTAAADFVVAGAQAMKFSVEKARGTKDVDFLLNVIALRKDPLHLAAVLESLGYKPVPHSQSETPSEGPGSAGASIELSFRIEEASILHKIDTVIVGGGQAGLAISYYLTQEGREHVALERAPAVANAWRNQRGTRSR